LIGFKPSRDAVARSDGFPVILLDCEVIGPIARTVADTRALFHALAGTPGLPPAPAPRPLRILYVRQFGGSPVDPEIAASVEKAAKHLGAFGHRVDDGEAPFDVDALNRAWPVISQAGLAWLMQSYADRFGVISPPMQDMARAGAALTATAYCAAVDVITRLRQTLHAFFEHTDLIMTPSIAALSWPAAEPFPPMIAGQSVGPRGHAVFTAFANMAGCPAISIPCAASKSGLPIGFHLVGPVGQDELVLATAAQYEKRHPKPGSPFPL
jgi:aspartyl-tRNA(Asn)/glutamyl-tRNA(Gln) amidotransferase subunit A